MDYLLENYASTVKTGNRDILYFKATRDSNGLIFKDELNVITDQINKSSYEGIENILRGLQTAKTRLNANVNFDLTMELLFLLIKENLV